MSGRQDHLHRVSTRFLNAKNASPNIWCKQNGPVPTPRTACRAQRRRRETLNDIGAEVDTFQLAFGKEREEVTIGRPERQRCALCSPNRTDGSVLEQSHVQEGNAAVQRGIGDLRSVGRQRNSARIRFRRSHDIDARLRRYRRLSYKQNPRRRDAQQRHTPRCTLGPSGTCSAGQPVHASPLRLQSQSGRPQHHEIVIERPSPGSGARRGESSKESRPARLSQRDPP